MSFLMALCWEQGSLESGIELEVGRGNVEVGELRDDHLLKPCGEGEVADGTEVDKHYSAMAQGRESCDRCFFGFYRE